MLHQNFGGVYRQSSSRTPTKRYLVPDIPQDKPQRTAGIGYFATGVFRSVRSYDGRAYQGDTINILEEVLDEIEVDGLRTVEVVIKYKNHEVTYSTTVATLRTHGQQVLAAGMQIALARHYWLVDGQAQPEPESIATQQPQPQPQAVQPALFDMPVERQRGEY